MRSPAVLLALAVAAAVAFALWRLGRPGPVTVQVATVGHGPVEATVTNTRTSTVKACRRAARLDPLAALAEQP